MFKICKNKEKYANNKSSQKGVCWHKIMKQYEAYISFNNKQEHLGYFSKLEDAARAYNAAAIKYFGEFAVLNKV